MSKSKKKNNSLGFWIFLLIIFYFFIKGLDFGSLQPNYFKVLSSYENASYEKAILKYAKKNDIKVQFTYKGDLDIIDELNEKAADYDAVWISNSMWLYLLDNPYLASDSKSLGISPVVFGIRKSKAKELGLIDNQVTNNDILNLIKDKKINYVMSSVTQTNTGATAYLGFVSALAGNPEVLTEEMLKDPQLEEDLINLFSGVERVSGDEDYLSEMFLNDSSYDAVIASEASLIEINNSLKAKKEDPLYLIYPSDGVAINDSTFGFINNDESKEEDFLSIQSYLLSDEGKELLSSKGMRTWYGGVSDKVDKKIFNKDWGIDTTKYLSVTKFPSKNVITAALNLYIERLRKPTHVVFCLDFSGSMAYSGADELSAAMEYILDYDQASADRLQFSEKDKITVIVFSSHVRDVWTIDNGLDTAKLISDIKDSYAGGSTDLYGAVIEGLGILSNENDNYTKTVIAMTDGMINERSFEELESYYKKKGDNIPIYSITFGDADEEQLEEIAKLSNARVFDGKKDLLEAFKKVRGYN